MPLDSYNVVPTVYDEKPRYPTQAVTGAIVPPCLGCPRFERCGGLGIVCLAFNEYVRLGWWVPGDVGSVPALVRLRRV
jgi:hypothetical protein